MSELLENRYRIIRELAEGGFGKTFIAEDTQMPSHRRCVIKQLKPMGEGSQIFELIKERFQREAVILEDLGNNNVQIPSLFAHFSSEGKFYLVQEYIEGETLAERVLKQGKLSESAVKEILIKLLTVLDFVHSKKIIHRDIKPENIILRSGDDTPVLIDFGAVREIMGTVMTPTGNSTRSIVIGTPGYMPSEQLAGRPMFTSDLYALALTMIYALTSKMPSEFDTDPQTGNIMWLQEAFSVSPTLANILEKAIAFNPHDRWQSARTMLQGLQGQTPASTILADENINKPAETVIADVQIQPPLPTEIATPNPPIYPNNSTVIQGNNNPSNNNLMVVIIGLLILIGFGGLGFFMYQQNQLYQAQMAKLEADRKKAEESRLRQEPEAVTKEKIANFNNTNTVNNLNNNRQNPGDFIYEHYQLLNNRDYETTWNNLSSNFQGISQGYNSYIQWWNSVNNINILNIQVINNNNSDALVKAQLVYSLSNGKKMTDRKNNIYLLWNNDQQKWLIHKKY